MEVIYERDPDVGNGFQAYRGRAQWAGGSEDFIAMHFEALLRMLHRVMPGEDMELTFIRSDRSELAPHLLKQELTLLIKTDVEKAIQEMSHPDVRIVVGRNPETPRILKSCGDTMAGAFGLSVLIRTMKKYTRVDISDSGTRGSAAGEWPHVECPCCGNWAALQVAVASATTEAWLACTNCKVRLPVQPINSEWASVETADLLSLERDKYFLPREWNNYQPWVSREKLLDLYKQFMKTKEQFNDR